MRKLLQGGALLLLCLSLACDNETRITELEPPQGTWAGGEEIVIKGNGFKPGVSVKFGKRDATNIAVSDKQIRVTSPAGEKNTTVDITLIFDDGRAFLLKNGFRYLEAADQSKVMKSLRF